MSKMGQYYLEMQERNEDLAELQCDYYHSWERESGLTFEEYYEMKTKPINQYAVKDLLSREEALDKLREVLVDRGTDYGSPLRNHGMVAELVNVLNKHHVRSGNYEAEDTMLMMILIKVARLMTTPEHTDSWLDIAGYALCAMDAIKEREQNMPF